MQRCENPSTETRWHIGLLTLMLVFGACSRFYGIDALGLGTNELNVLAACDSTNWFDMAVGYNNQTGMTPLYPTLLCQITDWTSRAEIFVRLLSTLTGLGIMFVIYMIGRDLISPVAGLFAAALVALDFQMVITSRDASVYSLLTLLLLLHHYYFCQLFFAKNRHKQHTSAFKVAGSHFQLLWHWQPDFPGNARYIAGFWITGVLAFYTSPMAILQLGAELLASCYLLKRSGLVISVPSAIRALWLPIATALLPWLPIIDHYRHWALDGNLFGLPQNLSFLRLINSLLLVNFWFHTGLFVLAILLGIVLSIKRKREPGSSTLLPTLFIYTAVLVLVAIIHLALLKPASPLSFLYVWVMVLLLMVTPAALLIDQLPANNMRYGALIIGLMVIVIAQTRADNASFLYKRGTDTDFRLAARILQSDEAFMNSRRKIYLTSPLFKHYLDTLGVSKENIQLVNRREPEADFHEPASNAYFYYLEYRPNMANNFAETAASKTLKEHYRLHCESRMGRIRVMKFARDELQVTSETGDCRSYLPHMGGM